MSYILSPSDAPTPPDGRALGMLNYGLLFFSVFSPGFRR